MARAPRRLIIHAGMHKTGSTAIQYWLHRTKLPGVHYFKWRNANHSDLFVLLFEENPQDHPAFARPGYTREQAMKDRAAQKARIRRQIEGSRKALFVFSAERVSTAPKAAVRNMHAFFSPLFADIQVHVYVRKPSGFMTSMFQQHLKTGRIKLSFGELWPSYRRRLGRLIKIFGRRNVHLRSYDQMVENGREIVGDFADWTGIPAAAPGNIVLNWSMSATGMALLYFYRKHVEPGLSVSERTRYQRHVLYAAQTIPGQRFHVDLACAGPQCERAARDLKWISKRMGADFDDLAVPRPGRRIFSGEDDILDHAVATSHHLMPWKHLERLDPDVPGSFEATKARFDMFLTRSSWARVGLRRGANRIIGRRPHSRP